MPSNTVTIDQTWIDGAGDAPYVLNQPDTVYTLGVDVNVVQAGFFGEVFKLVGNEIVLNPNGKKIRVNGDVVPQITDSMLYRRDSEHTVRVDNTKESIMYGGKHGTGIGKYGTVVDNIPDADRPLINDYARTK
jgi:hypothetical protein